MRLSFLAARPALNDIADRLERGETVRVPCRAGLLNVRYVEMSHEFLGAKPAPYIMVTDYDASPDEVGFLRGSPAVYSHWEPKTNVVFPVMLSHLMGDWFQTDKD